MIAMRITDIKTFMSDLLTHDTYDNFLMSEGSVTTFCTFSIDGTWQRDFYDPDHEDDSSDHGYTFWKDVRGSFYNVIKGTHTPLGFKFVFLLSPDGILSFISRCSLNCDPKDIFGLYMNYRFDGTNLLLTTGTSLRTFTKDRAIDQTWDQFVQNHLKRNGITAEKV